MGKRCNVLTVCPSRAQDSYLRYNNPGAGEQDMQDYARGVTYGIFSVLATMGAVPVIRCAPGGPAEMVRVLGRRLEREEAGQWVVQAHLCKNHDIHDI